MKLQQLRYFCAVVQTRSITLAAGRLGVSQPALSTALKALEDELGGALLEGRRGELRPTAQGDLFHTRAVGILAECEAAKATFRRDRNRRRIKLGLLSTLATPWIVALQRHLAAARPDLDIALRDGTTEQLLAALAEGRLDAAVMALALAPGTGWITVAEEPLMLACRHEDALAAAAAVPVQQLNGRAFVYRSHCELGRDGHEILKARGVRMNVVLATQQDARAFAAVEAGIGITFAPRSLIQDLTAVPLQDFGLTRRIGLHLADGMEPRLRDDLVAALTAALTKKGPIRG